MKSIDDLLNMCAEKGGRIINTSKLQPYEIESARQTGRMFVREDSLGFVWEPDIDYNLPAGQILEILDHYYPVPPPLPESLKPENFFARLYGPGSIKKTKK